MSVIDREIYIFEKQFLCVRNLKSAFLLGTFLFIRSNNSKKAKKIHTKNGKKFEVFVVL